MAKISRQEYNNLFGPTVGDKIRLGDTDLYVEIEKDLRGYDDEVVYGGGKTLRDGIALANTTTSDDGALDMVITNVTIIDAVLGVVKADVGIKDGKIAGIGKSGNPNIMSGVDPNLVTGAATDAISGEHLILTAGAIDGHVHMIAPQQAYAALSNWGQIVGQLMIRTFYRARVVGQAMAARGFDGTLPTTSRYTGHWTRRDSLFTGTWCVFFVLLRFVHSAEVLFRHLL